MNGYVNAKELLASDDIWLRREAALALALVPVHDFLNFHKQCLIQAVQGGQPLQLCLRYEVQKWGHC